MTKIGSVLFLCLFFCSKLLAALDVTATVDRNEMGLGDTFTITVSVASSESVDVQEPRIPNLDSFELMNNWTSSSTATKLVQGPGGMQFETLRRYDFNYMLTPNKEGRLTVPAFELVVDGKVYFTKPIIIEVNSASAGSSAGVPAETDGMDEAEELFNQLLQRRGIVPSQPAFKNLPKNQKEAFFIQVEVDKLEAFEGEQVTASWYIYTRGNLLTLDRLKFPDLKGFWKEIIEEVPALNFTQEVINGVPYKKALLASHALFPIKPGTAVIDEYKIKSQVQLPTSPFGSFGFGPAYTYTKSSERVKVTVKPLPAENRPADFSGAVGQFEIKSSIEGKEFPVNQPLAMKIRFEGEGNAKLIELPPLNLPPTVEIFETKFDSKFFKDGKSYKEFEVLVVPRQEGALKIPAISYSIFDPKAKVYVTKTTTGFDLNIKAAVESPNLAEQRLSGEKVNKKAQPTLPPIIMSYQANSSSSILAAQWFWIALYSLVLMILGLRAKLVLGEKTKKRDLRRELQARLKAAQKELSKGNHRQVGVSMTNTIYLVLGEIAGLGGAANELDRILDACPPSIRRELGEKILKLSELFQTLSFAPDEVLGALKEKDSLSKAISESEKVLNKAIDLSDKIESA